MIIAIANQKGGVAKTTTAHNLSAALAVAGATVLSIDLDSQASMTISMGKEPEDFDFTVCDILKKNPEPIEKCIYELPAGYSLIPSIIDLATLEMELMARTARETVLLRQLSKIKNNYDYIILDCPPQLSILTLNALAAADRVLIPCKTDYLSYRGLEQLKLTIQDIKELVNPDIEILGVIATFFEVISKDQKEILETMKSEYNVIGIIKKTVEAVKGVYDGMSVVERNPKSEIGQEYIKIAEYIKRSV